MTTTPTKKRPPTPAEQTLILQMYSNQLAQHVASIYLHDPSTYEQLWSSFKLFHEMLDRIEPHDRARGELKCPAGTYPCGPNRCCIYGQESDLHKGALEAKE